MKTMIGHYFIFTLYKGTIRRYFIVIGRTVTVLKFRVWDQVQTPPIPVKVSTLA